jgi:hypothetical protein
MTIEKDQEKKVKLKTFIITDSFEDDMKYLRDFYTTDAKIIREGVRLLALVRKGDAQVVRK